MDNSTEAALDANFTSLIADVDVVWAESTENLANSSVFGPTRTTTVYRFNHNTLTLTQVVYTVLLLVLGFLGNAISAVVMMRKRFKVMSFSVYLFMLAIVDTVHLIFNPITRRLFGILTGIQVPMVSTTLCKVFTFTMSTSATISSWLLCAVSLERMLVMLSPHRARAWFSVRKSWVIVALLSMAACSLFAKKFNMTTHGHFYDNKICFIVDPFWRNLYNIVLLFSYSFVPFGIIIICNVVIVVKAGISIRFRRAAGITLSSDEKTMIRLTVMVVVSSMVFLLLTVPYTAFLSYTITHKVTDDGYSRYMWLTMMQIMNHGINGYFYCISGSMFREELAKLFCSRKAGEGTKFFKWGNGSKEQSVMVKTVSFSSEIFKKVEDTEHVEEIF